MILVLLQIMKWKTLNAGIYSDVSREFQKLLLFPKLILAVELFVALEEDYLLQKFKGQHKVLHVQSVLHHVLQRQALKIRFVILQNSMLILVQSMK